MCIRDRPVTTGQLLLGHNNPKNPRPNRRGRWTRARQHHNSPCDRQHLHAPQRWIRAPRNHNNRSGRSCLLACRRWTRVPYKNNAPAVINGRSISTDHGMSNSKRVPAHHLRAQGHPASLPPHGTSLHPKAHPRGPVLHDLLPRDPLLHPGRPHLLQGGSNSGFLINGKDGVLFAPRLSFCRHAPDRS